MWYLERPFCRAFNADFERKTRRTSQTIPLLLYAYSSHRSWRLEILRDVDILLEWTNPLEHKGLNNSMNVTT
jgi:hypothetical protein